eukprot:TRINITY_DN80529_c0_g1_i1.p1 TRINITY_DN80529_c0_g1~~TRINITY_DN80529_c0_g1_i1.p1  ORF type:complete len:618 (-),score=237.09 TRINITY_DN80529_c0_g1_i1:303-2156(-)
MEEALEQAGWKDFLSKLFLRILEEKPSNPAAAFVQTGKLVERGEEDPDVQPFQTIEPNPNILPSQQSRLMRHDIVVSSEDDSRHRAFLNVVKPPSRPSGEEEEPTEEEEAANTDFVKPNLMVEGRELQRFGIGLSREDYYRLSIGIQRLCEQNPIKSARFWGLLFGLENNYFVVETEFKEDQRPGKKPEGGDGGEEAESEETEGDEGKLPPEDFREPWEKVKKVETPSEVEEGTNRYVYFVCTDLATLNWVLLPDVTPQQITVSRSIRRFLTGKLDASVKCFPPFPGKEKELVRALIARISAGTLVGPSGFAKLSGEEEEENGGNDEETKGTSDKKAWGPLKEIKTTEFISDFATEPKKLKLLENWVHIEPHISQILGRCTLWVPPKEGGENEEEEENEEETEEDEDEEAAGKRKKKKEKPRLPQEEEQCPPQLTPCNADEGFGTVKGEVVSKDIHAWSVQEQTGACTDELHTSFAIRSNRWPGAMCVAFPIGVSEAGEEDEEQPEGGAAKKNIRYRVVNFYAGFGLKHSSETFTPQLPQRPEDSYEIVAERTMIKDGEESSITQLPKEIPEPDHAEEYEFHPPTPPPPPVEGEEEEKEGEDEQEDEQEEDEEEDDA